MKEWNADEKRDASFSDARDTGIPRVPLDAGDDRPQPTRRFLAKSFDIAVASLIGLLLFNALGPLLGFGPGRDQLSAFVMSVAFLLFWAVLEVLMLANLGTTPGRMLYGISVKQKSGAALTFDDAVWRSLRLLAFGLGFGLPVIGFITQLVAYLRLVNSGQTSWDRKGGLRVTQRSMLVAQWIGALLLTTAVIVAAVQVGA